MGFLLGQLLRLYAAQKWGPYLTQIFRFIEGQFQTQKNNSKIMYKTNFLNNLDFYLGQILSLYEAKYLGQIFSQTFCFIEGQQNLAEIKFQIV